MDKERYSRLIFADVRIDVKQVIAGNKIKDFAINVSILSGNERKDVFRVDTAHGYLHVQKFWISGMPEKLQDRRKKDYKGDFGSWKDKVLKNYEEYVNAYKNKFGMR